MNININTGFSVSLRFYAQREWKIHYFNHGYHYVRLTGLYHRRALDAS